MPKFGQFEKSKTGKTVYIKVGVFRSGNAIHMAYQGENGFHMRFTPERDNGSWFPKLEALLRDAGVDAEVTEAEVA
jgi:hypothetical protein